MKEKCRLLYIIPSLEPGGAEKLSVSFLNKIDRNLYEPALCYFERKGELFDQLPRQLTTFDLGKKGRFSLLRLLLSLRRVIRRYKPDIIFSRNWYANLVSVMAKKLFFIKPELLVFIEHNDLRDLFNRQIKMRFKKILTRGVFRHADRVVVVSHGVKKELRKDFHLSRKKIAVINNSVDIRMINALKDAGPVKMNWFNESIPVIISMGKLLPRKGFPDLIKAFKIVRAKKDCRLVIIGQGEERRNLSTLIKLYNLESDMQLAGYVENPYPAISRARDRKSVV
jgi:glycosyltransferase involved in cell wall biosynthesis